MKRIVSIGEAMVEFSGGAQDLYRLGFAGDTLNTAWYARALLPQEWTVDYVSALGDDLYSERMRDFLGENGIGNRHIRRIEGKCVGLYVTHQEDGDRRFTYWRSDSAARQLMKDGTAVATAITDAALVYFSGITLAILDAESRIALLDTLTAERAKGAKIAFDPNIRPRLWESPEVMREVLSRGAAVADIVLPTYGDEAEVFDDANPRATADRYRALGAEEVVVKNGSDNALVILGEKEAEVAAERPEEIKDTTGAGDSFNAAYLSARLLGCDPAESATRAHRMAARVICHHGALLPRDKIAG